MGLRLVLLRRLAGPTMTSGTGSSHATKGCAVSWSHSERPAWNSVATVAPVAATTRSTTPMTENMAPATRSNVFVTNENLPMLHRTVRPRSRGLSPSPALSQSAVSTTSGNTMPKTYASPRATPW